MPVAPTYPGVYIEEVSSGVHTLVGVSTSITAFIGRALRGPVDEPVTIHSFADFERTFGGLWTGSTLGFSVQDFFMNGGGEALVVRVYTDQSTSPPSSPPAAGNRTATIGIAAGGTGSGTGAILFEAASPGAWGNHLRVRVQYESDPDILSALTARYGHSASAFFNLYVHDAGSGETEEFLNLTVVDGPRRVDHVLASTSRLVRVATASATDRPDDHFAMLPSSAAPGATIWTDNTTSTGVAHADEATDGDFLDAADVEGSEAQKTGIFALEKADLFNLMCIPPFDDVDGVPGATLTKAITYCEQRRAVFIVDPPPGWIDKAAAKLGIASLPRSKNAAVYFPGIRKPNPLRENRLEDFAPSGAVAGVMARTDMERGVWKAPAGLDARLVGVAGMSVPLTDPENGELNPLGVNCLRVFPAAGPVVWGARTLVGDDRLASEWKYLPIRRLALFLEESLYRGTQWVVFEPNDEPLWAQIRLNLGAFMQNLFRQGAFQGQTPREAYFVKCDKETTTQTDVNLGIVNILVGFAPLKPAEFVIIKIQQIAGQIAT